MIVWRLLSILKVAVINMCVKYLKALHYNKIVAQLQALKKKKKKSVCDNHVHNIDQWHPSVIFGPKKSKWMLLKTKIILSNILLFPNQSSPCGVFDSVHNFIDSRFSL